MAKKSKSKSIYKCGGAMEEGGTLPQYAGLGNFAGSLLQNTNSPVGTIGGGMLKGAASGAMLGPVGAGVGAVLGLGQGLLQNKQNKEMQAQQEQMINQAKIAQSLQQFQQANKLYDMGGGLPDTRLPNPNMNRENTITEYNGPSHEQGGIPVGENAEVEGNETRGIRNTEDYIFSDTLKPNKKAKKTFADISKDVEKKYKNYENDRYAIKSKDMELSRLMYEQEALKKNMYEKSMYEDG